MKVIIWNLLNNKVFVFTLKKPARYQELLLVAGLDEAEIVPFNKHSHDLVDPRTDEVVGRILSSTDN